MRHIFAALAWMAGTLILSGQNTTTIESLFKQQKYADVILLSSQKRSLKPEEMLLVGQAYFMTNQEDKAIGMYDMALLNGMDLPITHYLKAQAFRYLNKPAEALKSIDIFLKAVPNSSNGWYEKGMNLYQMQKFADADSAFHRAVKFEPVNPGAWYMRAHISHYLKDEDKAYNFLLEAIQHIPANDPHAGMAWYDKGLIESGRNQNELARESFMKAFRAGNDDPRLVSRLLRMLGNDEDRIDSVISVVRTRCAAGLYPDHWARNQYVPVSVQSLSDNQKIIIYRHFKTPIHTGDLYYTIEILDSSKVVRHFFVELVPRIGLSGSMYHLKEKSEGRGLTVYDPGWNVPIIHTTQISETIMQILNGTLKSGVRSMSPPERPGRSNKKSSR